MTLMWGMIPHLAPAVGHDNPSQITRRVARELGLADNGEFVVMVRGFHSDPEWNSPSISALQLSGEIGGIA